MSADLAHDTRVEAVAGVPGLFAAHLPEAWSFLHPSGGVLMTVGLRAMTAFVDQPALRLVSATTTFCSPIPAGELAIRVTALRVGRRAAQLRAHVRPVATEGTGLEICATFAVERAMPGVGGPTAPTAPKPMDAPPYPAERLPMVPRFYRNFDVRRVIGDVSWDADWAAAEPHTARWFRYLHPQRTSDGRADPLALPPIADTMASAFHQGLGPTQPRILAPSLDLTVYFLEDTDSDWFLVDSRCRGARAGIATGDAAIWDDAGRLVALSSQMMFLTELG